MNSYDSNYIEELLKAMNDEQDYSGLKNSDLDIDSLAQKPGLLGDVPQPNTNIAPVNNNAAQALETMRANNENMANQMLSQSNAQVQQGIQNAQQLDQQRESQMQDAEQQAAQELKKQQAQQAGLFKLAMMIYGAGAGSGAGAADASGMTDAALEQTAGESAFMTGGDLAAGMEHMNAASGDWLTKAMNPGGVVEKFDFTKGLNRRFF